MKKFGLLTLAALLLLVSCGKEDETGKYQQPVENTPYFYGVKRSEAKEGDMSRQGVAQYNKLWHPCTTIKVRFLSNPNNFKEEVKTYAKEWEQYSSIRFEFVETGNADVRISFDDYSDRYVTWSYIGTDCRTVADQSKPTANFCEFGWRTAAQRKGDVLRIFGQILGLELEHRNLNFNPQWAPNPNKVPAYWASIITDADWATIRQYVFDPLSNSSNMVCTNQYDAQSIMCWPFPSNILFNGNPNENLVLSSMDKAFIAQLYPPNACSSEAILIAKTAQKNVKFQILRTGDVTVDWGDGTRENLSDIEYAIPQYGVTPYDPNVREFAHSYATATEHTIKLYGSTQAITSFYGGSCGENNLLMLDVSKNANLSVLTLGGHSQLRELDVSKNKFLTYLSIGGSPINSLDVSKNLMLKDLSCVACQLTNIDLSQNIYLEHFNCGSDNIISLDLSKNLLLNSFSCDNGKLSALDVSNNTKLQNIQCISSQLTTLDVSKNKQLIGLHCEGNKLTSLTLSGATQLSVVYCNDNLLPNLNLSGTNMTILGCYNNPFTTNGTALTQLAQSLPSKLNVQPYARLIIHNLAFVNTQIGGVCSAKNWHIE